MSVTTKSTYKRFLNGGTGGKSLSDSWVGWESFVVGRADSEVDYEPQIGDTVSDTSTVVPYAKRKTWMANPTRQLPPMPDIGRPESFYAKLVHSADQQGQTHCHEAAKVGQYITLAMDHSLSWEEKLKYFRHAIKRHCVPPAYPDDDVWMFYQQLAELVRQHCGYEALRLASTEDDMYAARLAMGQEREKIEDDAEAFFARLLSAGDQCPEWFTEEDWNQLKMLRDQWI